jgi:tRNA(Ile2) C34 agmatinyltransferase TiaS
LATPRPTLSDAAIQVAADDPVAAGEVEAADRAVEEPALLELAPVETPVEAEKETCPTCGKTGVFAGPPGQRFCTYCALRDELFERAAVTE